MVPAKEVSADPKLLPENGIGVSDVMMSLVAQAECKEGVEILPNESRQSPKTLSANMSLALKSIACVCDGCCSRPVRTGKSLEEHLGKLSIHCAIRQSGKETASGRDSDFGKREYLGT